MTSAPTSLVDRAGLERPRLAKIISHGLEGADDGELFLEYRQAEMLVLDNGRLKQATYDTSQGFGLRAVKDEAVGYAHASDVSEGAIARAADAVRAVKGGYSGHYAGPPAQLLTVPDNPTHSEIRFPLGLPGSLDMPVRSGSLFRSTEAPARLRRRGVPVEARRAQPTA